MRMCLLKPMLTCRALFALHWHNPPGTQSGSHLHPTTPLQDTGSSSASDASLTPSMVLEPWSSRSQVALDTATKMVVDVVEAHGSRNTQAPSYSYMVLAALKHIHGKSGWSEDSWLRAAESRLRAAIDTPPIATLVGSPGL